MLVQQLSQYQHNGLLISERLHWFG